MPIWVPLVAKATLIAFLVIGTAVLVITYIRRRRRVTPWRSRYADPYLRSIYGGAPPTPLPEWAYWDEETGHDDNPAGPPRAGTPTAGSPNRPRR